MERPGWNGADIGTEANKGPSHLLYTWSSQAQMPLPNTKLCTVSQRGVPLPWWNQHHRQICLWGTRDSLNSHLSTQRSESHSCPGPAMGPRLLHCVAFCLLGAGESRSERTSLTKAILSPGLCLSFMGNMTLLLHSVSKSSTSSAGHIGAMVIQNPGYLVTRMGKPVTLSCSQNLNHEVMFWYQQKLSPAPSLLFYYYDKEFNNEKDTSDNLQSSWLNTSFCSLGIRSAGLGDSATYLCASSRDTELKPYLPSVHKPLFPRSKSLL